MDTTTAQQYSTKPELRFCANSIPACDVSEVCDDEKLLRLLRLKIRFNIFCRSVIPPKQFMVIMVTRPSNEQYIAYTLVTDPRSWVWILAPGSLVLDSKSIRSGVWNSSPFNSYYKVWQVLESAEDITRCDKKLLQSVTRSYYKVGQVLRNE